MFPLSWVWWLACLGKILVKSDTSRARFWPFKPIKTGLKLARLPLRFPHSCGHGCRVKTDRCDSDWRTDGAPNRLFSGEDVHSSLDILVAFFFFFFLQTLFPALVAAVFVCFTLSSADMQNPPLAGSLQAAETTVPGLEAKSFPLLKFLCSPNAAFYTLSGGTVGAKPFTGQAAVQIFPSGSLICGCVDVLFLFY